VRIHSLNTLAREALAAMPHVRLHTRMSPALSASMVCFDVAGHTAEKVEAHLMKQGIVASTTRHRASHARLALG